MWVNKNVKNLSNLLEGVKKGGPDTFLTALGFLYVILKEKMNLQTADLL